MSDATGTKLVGSSKVPSLQIRNEVLGTPGAHIVFHIIPKFDGDQSSDDDVLSDTLERQFRVSAKLSHAPSAIGKIRADFGEKDGDSFSLLPNNATQFQIDTSEGRFYIKSNDEKQLSLIEWECRASSPGEARARFISVAYPALDHFSYSNNVPLFVATIRVVDVKHQSIHIDCDAPYWAQIVPNTMNVLFLDMKPIYREAKNSNSYFYKFLCCYKIMEGLLGTMRASAFTRAKKAGVELTSERVQVPGDEQLTPEFKTYVGKSIKVLFDDLLTPEFRHAVAHFMTGEGALLLSSAAALDRYSSAALVADLCARRLIASHELLLRQLPQV